MQTVQSRINDYDTRTLASKFRKDENLDINAAAEQFAEARGLDSAVVTQTVQSRMNVYDKIAKYEKLASNVTWRGDGHDPDTEAEIRKTANKYNLTETELKQKLSNKHNGQMFKGKDQDVGLELIKTASIVLSKALVGVTSNTKKDRVVEGKLLEVFGKVPGPKLNSFDMGAVKAYDECKDLSKKFSSLSYRGSHWTNKTRIVFDAKESEEWDKDRTKTHVMTLVTAASCVLSEYLPHHNKVKVKRGCPKVIINIMESAIKSSGSSFRTGTASKVSNSSTNKDGKKPGSRKRNSDADKSVAKTKGSNKNKKQKAMKDVKTKQNNPRKNGEGRNIGDVVAPEELTNNTESWKEYDFDLVAGDEVCIRNKNDTTVWKVGHVVHVKHVKKDTHAGIKVEQKGETKTIKLTEKEWDERIRMFRD